ncbi:2-C-methyl-D-erythritol 4-phosphate cytidylyltransferase [Spirochaetia bacterium]|nr:2-C-methyl-D-erythritol 4-phosphate cytidylyltransferase [Spirochaetia bacterium]
MIMHIALIFAGGSGIRMNVAAKPKQFLQLYGKEIIIHTIEHFGKHPEIDGIVVVCIESWIPFLKTLLEKFNINKVKWIVSGGADGQESIYCGLSAIKNTVPDDSVVLIHDGVRPLITQKLISDCIASVISCGNAITVTPAVETIVSLDAQGKITAITDRSKCFHAKAPQCFRLADIWQAHTRAKADGLTNTIDSASLMKHYGYELYTVQGTCDNIKITTPSDFYTFRALYEARENSQIFGL